MGFQLDNISKSVSTSKKDKASESLSFLKKEITLFNNAFSNKIKEDFYTELGVLLKAGVSLKVALELIEKSQKKKPNKEILNTMSKDIVSGQSLSDALKVHKQFTNYEFHSIKIGEETGTLSQVVEQLGSFFARKNEQRRNLISALIYPIIILSTAILVVVFMLHYVVPMFQDIFKQQGVELPTITKFIIKLSEFMKAYGGLFLLLLLGLIISKSFLNKNKKFKQLKDKFILRVPFIGNFVNSLKSSCCK